MKKIFSQLMTTTVILFSSLSIANAQEVIIPEESPKDNVLVPLNGVFEVFDTDYTWNNITKSIELSNVDASVSIQIGSNEMIVNGQTKKLNKPANLKENRTFIPLEVLEALGYDVGWDPNAKEVLIDSWDKKVGMVVSGLTSEVLFWSINK
jgi:hypothetical protein